MALRIAALLCLFEVAQAGIIDKAYNIPDTAELAGKPTHIFNVFESDPSRSHMYARPSSEYYKRFYDQYHVRFVNAMPKFDKAVTVDYFVLTAPISENAFQRQAPGARIMGRRAISHTGIGFVPKDKDGNELARIAASFWTISNQDVDKQYVREGGSSDDPLTFLNRAVTTYTISSPGDWENKYWDGSENVKFVKTLLPGEYDKGSDLIREYSQNFPFYTSTELRDWKNDLVHPSATCNTFTHYITKELAGRDALRENLAPMGWGIAVLAPHQVEAIDQHEAAQHIEKQGSDLAATQGAGMKMVVLPKFYSADGQLLEHSEMPQKFYVFRPVNFYFRNNLFMSTWGGKNMANPFTSR